MKVEKTAIAGVLIIEPQVFGDERGWFTEVYSKIKFNELGITADFVQDNHSYSAVKGTLRGLHYQINPKAQAKMIRCSRGKVLDVAVDLRKGSSTYKRWVAVELSADNKRQLFVPKGFAHGFLTLSDDVEVQYKVDQYYAPECDRSIRYDDPEIRVEWGISKPILSEKDRKAPMLADADLNFGIKVLVTGINGQLGFDLLKRLKTLGFDANGVERKHFDITDREAVSKYIEHEKPELIVHCGAYTKVDQAEEEKELCYKVNLEGTKNIAEAAKAVGAKLVYVSTDYVFDGAGNAPHLESAKTNPVNYYGYTKELGEQAVQSLLEEYYIVRTSWLYGLNGNNFVKTMLKLAESKDELSVVNDQVGSPTYTGDLAQFIADLVQTDQFGIYHGVNEGYCSWYEFAKEIFSASGIDMKLKPVSSEAYPTRAKRPNNSRLATGNNEAAHLDRLPDWQDALGRFLMELKGS